MAGSRDETIESIERQVAVLVRQAEMARADRPMPERLVRSGYLLLTELEEGGPLTTAALGAAMGVDISTASRQIAPLEDQGLVKRLPNPEDRRSSVIGITALGLERLGEARADRYRVYADLLAEWSIDDRRQLAELLRRLNEAIRSRRRERVKG